MSTQYPHRRVTLTVEHTNIGESLFAPLVHEAMAEYRGRDPLGMFDYFTASNGVRITVNKERMDINETAFEHTYTGT